MKRAFHLLLLLGALFGLLGQTAAYAAASRVSVTPMAQMDAGCMQSMEGHQPQPAQDPCKALTLDCITAMGCIAPAIVREPGLSQSATASSLADAFWPTVTVLLGGDLAPEPEPPILLG